MRLSVFRYAKFGPQLKELRIHLCQTGKESEGVRNFINSSYVALKKDNPKLPILVRECSGVQPRAWARYELGVEKSVSLTNAAAADVVKQIEALGQMKVM